MIENALQAYHFILLIAAIGMFVSTLEYLAVLPSFANSGVYSWRIFKLRYGAYHRFIDTPIVDNLMSERGIKSLLILRLVILIFVILVPIGSVPFTLGMGLLVSINLLFSGRNFFGDDGSDQMNSILLIVLFLCVSSHGSDLLLNAGLWFITFQACLSYVSAGVAKLVSRQWRSGDALFRVLNTGTYGLKWAAVFLQRRQGLSALLSWPVMLLETLFPLCLILPSPWNWTILAWGVLFHFSCAAIMGLNSFFWAFVATYPAILYVIRYH